MNRFVMFLIISGVLSVGIQMGTHYDEATGSRHSNHTTVMVTDADTGQASTQEKPEPNFFIILGGVFMLCPIGFAVARVFGGGWATLVVVIAAFAIWLTQ